MCSNFLTCFMKKEKGCLSTSFWLFSSLIRRRVNLYASFRLFSSQNRGRVNLYVSFLLFSFEIKGGGRLIREFEYLKISYSRRRGIDLYLRWSYTQVHMVDANSVHITRNVKNLHHLCKKIVVYIVCSLFYYLTI